VHALVEAGRPAARARGGLTAALADRYGGDLWIPLRDSAPTVIANFVTSLDGVVSYQTPDAMGGGEISGFYEPDRFVMGILRSLADVVLIGAGTVRATPKHRWVPEHVSRAYAADFAEVRSRLGLRPQPLVAVLSASADIDLAHPGLSDPQVPVLIMVPWFIVGIALLVEINFRGFLLGRLAASESLLWHHASLRRLPPLALMTSALVFAFDPFMVHTFRHLHWIALWDGLVWGLLWLLTRNLYVTIVAHAVEVIVVYSAVRSVLMS